MEADIGNPIEFDKELKLHHHDDQEPEPEYYQHQHQQQQPMMYPQMMMYPQKNNDIFSNIEKSTWIIGFVVFLLGFFMGKTMQPVILRPG